MPFQVSDVRAVPGGDSGSPPNPQSQSLVRGPLLLVDGRAVRLYFQRQGDGWFVLVQAGADKVTLKGADGQALLLKNDRQPDLSVPGIKAELTAAIRRGGDVVGTSGRQVLREYPTGDPGSRWTTVHTEAPPPVKGQLERLVTYRDRGTPESLFYADVTLTSGRRIKVTGFFDDGGPAGTVRIRVIGPDGIDVRAQTRAADVPALVNSTRVSRADELAILRAFIDQATRPGARGDDVLNAFERAAQGALDSAPTDITVEVKVRYKGHEIDVRVGRERGRWRAEFRANAGSVFYTPDSAWLLRQEAWWTSDDLKILGLATKALEAWARGRRDR